VALALWLNGPPCKWSGGVEVSIQSLSLICDRAEKIRDASELQMLQTVGGRNQSSE